MIYLSAIGYFVCGVPLLFAGYNIYRGFVFLLGFIFGAFCGALFVAFFAPGVWLLILIGALMGGLFGAALFRLLQGAAFFCVGAAVGAALGHTFSAGAPQTTHIIVTVAAAVVFAVTTTLIQKPALVVATSIFGAALVVAAFAQVITQKPALAAIKSGQVSPLALAITLGVALVGAAMQVLSSRRR